MLHRLTNHKWFWPLGRPSSFLLILALTAACENRFERTLHRADAAAQMGHFRIALSGYESLLILEPDNPVLLKAAREGARIAYFEVKDYQRALDFYKHLVYHSPDPEEALMAQRQVVSIYFEHLADYEKAILETAKLIEIEKDPQKKLEAHLKVARSHYQLNRFLQASFEIDEAFRLPESQKMEFDLKLLKANVLTAQKKYSDAILLLKELLTKWRERAIKENVPMTLAVCYEEMKDFKGAISILESVKAEHPVPEYVDLRIKRITERVKNAPGAKGLHK